MLIENEILAIRNMYSNDILPLHRLLSDENVMRYVENIFSYNKTKEFAYKYGLNDDPFIFSVDLKGEGFIGYVLLKKYNENNTYEIGWFLFPEYWNKGYASKLTEMLINYSLSIGIKTLIIEFDKNQKYSEIIAHKFQFQFVKREDNLLVYSRSF